MTKIELINALRKIEEYHKQRSFDASTPGAISMHTNYANAATEAVNQLVVCDYLSQALNEGDGTYKP